MAKIRARLTVPGQVLVVAWAAAGLGTLLFHQPVLMVLFAFTTGLLLLSLTVGQVLRRLELTELAPARMVEGDARVLDLPLRLTGRLPLVAVELRGETEGLALSADLPYVPAGRGAQPAEVRALRRGRVLGLSVKVVCAAPFGLMRHRRTVRIPTDIWVLPRAHALREHILEQMLVLKPRGLDLPQPSGPGEAEFYALREFREGDSEKRVHPRLSARRGRKVLRVFQGEAPPQVHLVLDLRVPGHQHAFQRVDFEEAIRFAAGMIKALLLRHVPVTLDLIGRQGLQHRVSDHCRDLYTYLAALSLTQPVRESQPPDQPALPPALPRGGRRVLVHLGQVDESLLPREWLPIQAGSQRYYQLLQPTFA